VVVGWVLVVAVVWIGVVVVVVFVEFDGVVGEPEQEIIRASSKIKNRQNPYFFIYLFWALSIFLKSIPDFHF